MKHTLVLHFLFLVQTGTVPEGEMRTHSNILATVQRLHIYAKMTLVYVHLCERDSWDWFDSEQWLIADLEMR